MAGIILAGEWKSCIDCLNAKAQRFAVPKTANERTDELLGRVLCDIAGAMKFPSVGEKHFVFERIRFQNADRLVDCCNH